VLRSKRDKAVNCDPTTNSHTQRRCAARRIDAIDQVVSVSDAGSILTVEPARAEVEMGSITPYESAKGRRYRVRYRKPDHTEAEKRGFIEPPPSFGPDVL
jgi:hypothetical protein